SLAHELAAAMLPDSSMNSSLAEELGLDLSDVAESDSNDQSRSATPSQLDEGREIRDGIASSGSEQYMDTTNLEETIIIPPPDSPPSSMQPTLSFAVTSVDNPAHIPLEQLSKHIEATNILIQRLKHLDALPLSQSPRIPTTSLYSSTPFNEPSIERYATRIIRQLNDSAREREIQVRELAAIEMEFRKISDELGGQDAIGALEPLHYVEGLSDVPDSENSISGPGGHLQPLAEIEEEDAVASSTDSDDEQDYSQDEGNFPEGTEPHVPRGQLATPSGALPLFGNLRDITASLVQTLGSITEYAQENGVATADAGRKIRAVKGRLVGWQTEWDSAEHSMLRIGEWEQRVSRVDGRALVREHLDAFGATLVEAASRVE
ncbi:hypothetical protein DL93DRAFT_2043629, partial [Clavulina sp. PMI_390]